MPETFQHVLQLVRAACFDESVKVDCVPPAETLRKHIQHNRLASLMYTMLKTQGVAAEGQWDGLQDQYLADTLRNAKRLRVGMALAEAYEAEGIPTLCYRGPFSGLKFYEDLATRPFQDIDLIVPDEHAERAYEIAMKLGFSSQQENISPGFFRRHHIHWAIQRDGCLLDLHWRIEHPYTLYRIQHDEIFERSRMVKQQGYTWREPCPMHLFLLCCLQLTKTEPAALCLAQDPNAAEHLFDRALFWKWMDQAMIWSRRSKDANEAIDLAELLETARAWRAESSLAATLAGLETLFGLDVPSALKSQLQSEGAWPVDTPAFTPETDGPAWLGQLTMKRGGFRFKRVRDMGEYILPPADYFPGKGPALALQRGTHFIHGLGKMAFVLADGVWTLGLHPLLNKSRRSQKPNDVLLRST